MTILEKIYAFGHENVRCSHNSTIEITKENYLTRKGTCILGINASKGCFDLNDDLKKRLHNGQKIDITIELEHIKDSFFGYGHPDLRLLNKDSIVFRKSNFICDRTVLINCSKSSSELNRDLVTKLRNQEKKFSIIFSVDGSNEKITY
ncbi:MAG: DUF371 domain-containing protein [Promethearchaeota archaeon]